jgi:hypothetical protein
MGFMSLVITLFLVLPSLPAMLLAQEMIVADIFFNANTTMGETDDNYICATIDWFPSTTTCRDDYCMLQNSSAITLVSIYIYPLIFIYTAWFIYISEIQTNT